MRIGSSQMRGGPNFTTTTQNIKMQNSIEYEAKSINIQYMICSNNVCNMKNTRSEEHTSELQSRP